MYSDRYRSRSLLHTTVDTRIIHQALKRATRQADQSQLPN